MFVLLCFIIYRYFILLYLLNILSPSQNKTEGIFSGKNKGSGLYGSMSQLFE